jgi:hypothetical protein
MRLKTGGLEPGEDRGRDVFALSADSGLARAFSLILTHEGTLPLSLRFLERQGGDSDFTTLSAQKGCKSINTAAQRFR